MNIPGHTFSYASLQEDLSSHFKRADDVRQYFEYCNCDLAVWPATTATLKNSYTPPTEMAEKDKGPRKRGRGSKGKGRSAKGGGGKSSNADPAAKRMKT